MRKPRPEDYYRASDPWILKSLEKTEEQKRQEAADLVEILEEVYEEREERYKRPIRDEWITIKTRFATLCMICGKAIGEGELAFWNPMLRRVCCEDCYENGWHETDTITRRGEGRRNIEWEWHHRRAEKKGQKRFEICPECGALISPVIHEVEGQEFKFCPECGAMIKEG